MLNVRKEINKTEKRKRREKISNSKVGEPSARPRKEKERRLRKRGGASIHPHKQTRRQGTLWAAVCQRIRRKMDKCLERPIAETDR